MFVSELTPAVAITEAHSFSSKTFSNSDVRADIEGPSKEELVVI